jgi:hypothetical protein
MTDERVLENLRKGTGPGSTEPRQDCLMYWACRVESFANSLAYHFSLAGVGYNVWVFRDQYVVAGPVRCDPFPLTFAPNGRRLQDLILRIDVIGPQPTLIELVREIAEKDGLSMDLPLTFRLKHGPIPFHLLMEPYTGPNGKVYRGSSLEGWIDDPNRHVYSTDPDPIPISLPFPVYG